MSGTIQYTIRPYDTIYMLAQVFHTTVESIMNLNPGISPENLQIGHVISIMPGFAFTPLTPGMKTPVTPGMKTPVTPGMKAPVTPGMRTPVTPGMTAPVIPEQGQELRTMPGAESGESMSDNPRDFGECDGMQEELNKYFRMLWEQHITWTRLVAMGIILDLPATDLMVQRLQRNATDFGNAFRTFYGDDIANEFEKLMAEHIEVAAEIVKAAKAGDSNKVADAEQRWFENANEIAEFLGRINPYWSSADWSAMMNEHLELLRDNILDMLSQNYEESINGYDDVEAQALEMADIMAEGLSMQFPE